MKCINKARLCIFCAISFACILLTGCMEKDYKDAYSPHNTISSFQMTTDQKVKKTEAFAEKLAVTAEDVLDGTDVDMTEASAAGLFDVNHANVIYAKNIHEKFYPASLTKVMTALCALKYGNPEDVITVTADAANITESGAQLCGLKQGDTLTLDQALHALLIYSANDAAVAIADYISGDTQAFAELMNQEAKAIGATNSHFVNPNGLHDDNHYVTAYDMYLIFNEAIKYNLFTQIINMTDYSTTYANGSGGTKTLEFHTTNQYLNGTYSEPENITVLGGKTGTTNAALNCLILLSKDTSDNSYISVILHSKERQILYAEMTDLLSEINK